MSVTIGCMPRAGHENPPVPSVVSRCVDCGEEVWISVGMNRAEPDAELVCMGCLVTRADQDGPIEIVVHPAQKAVLAEWLVE